MEFQVKRREDDHGMGENPHRVHFELRLSGRRAQVAATATVEDGEVLVNWSALGEVTPRAALEFAQGLAAMVHAANLEVAATLPAPPASGA